MASNVTLLCVNRFIRRAMYATELDFDAIRHNLLSTWVWDNDGFTVNLLGHPYQGSFYFTAGRANGLGFWGSSALTMANSILWEYAFETETPSVNDLVVTTMGGAAVGEVLHRLYADARARGLPLPVAFVISPMDCISDLVTRRGRRIAIGDSGEISSLSLAAGFSVETRHLDAQRLDESSGVFPAGFAFLDIVYGDPFGLNSSIPYEHFDFSTSVSWSLAGYLVSILTDGALVSRSVLGDAGGRTSLSLNMHYDFVLGSEIRLSSVALGPSLKRESHLSGESTLRLRAHLAWVLLGGSDYVYLTFGNSPPPEGGGAPRMYDMGTGTQAKVSLQFERPGLGAFELRYALYWLYTIPASVLKPDGSEGHTLTGFAVASYEYPIAHGFSVGIADSFCHKAGWYDDAQDVFEWINSTSLFVRKRFY
jgi:hypothetical protein